jgi:hypothetical protein
MSTGGRRSARCVAEFAFQFVGQKKTLGWAFFSVLSTYSPPPPPPPPRDSEKHPAPTVERQYYSRDTRPFLEAVFDRIFGKSAKSLQQLSDEYQISKSTLFGHCQKLSALSPEEASLLCIENKLELSRWSLPPLPDDRAPPAPAPAQAQAPAPTPAPAPAPLEAVVSPVIPRGLNPLAARSMLCGSVTRLTCAASCR